MFKVDKYGQVINCYESAMAVRDTILKFRACAISLSLGDSYTMFHISFVNLEQAIPNSKRVENTVRDISYQDGSARGVQFNVDRWGSYALPWNQVINHMPSFCDKIGLGEGDGKYLEPFFNTVLTGKNGFTQECQCEKCNIGTGSSEGCIKKQ